MTPPDLQCPDCSTSCQSDDNYCRQCGMYLAALRPAPPAPASRESRALEPLRPGLPTPVKRAATALAIGTALQIGIGVAGKYLATQAARSAATSAGSMPRPRKRTARGRELERRADQRDDPLADAAAVSETVIIRRVWIRRP